MAFDIVWKEWPVSYDEALIPFGQPMGKLSNAVDIDCRYYIRDYTFIAAQPAEPPSSTTVFV